jgi:hypothetical protein
MVGLVGRTSFYAILAVIAVAVVAAVVYAVHVMHGLGSHESLSSCRDDVAIVYLSGQDRLAQLMAQHLTRQLAGRLEGGICLVKGGVKGLPAYPAILVRGKAEDVFGRILLNRSLEGGWKLVRFDYVEPFAAQIAVAYRLKGGPVFERSARLLVVDGSTPFTRVNVTALREMLSQERYRVLFSAMFVANITGVEVAEKPPGNVTPRVLPAFYAVSSYNLSDGAPSVRPVAKGVYGVDLNVAAMLAGTRVLKAFEERWLPSVTGHPSLGSGRVHIALFEDFACPICAMFYARVMPLLIGYAENNTVTIHFMDLIVHNEANVTRAHSTLICLYEQTGNSTLYYHLASEIYRTLNIYASERKGNTFLSWLGSYIANISRSYNVTSSCRSASLVEESTREALRAGIMGTPGFAVWLDGWNRSIIFTGYHDIGFFRQLISWLEQQG